MLRGVDPELLAFCEPWLAREPRLLLACRYATEGAPRARVLASQVLLREFTQAAIAASDRRVAEARLHWWLEEAACWRQGHARHPLARGIDVPLAAPGLSAVAARWLAWLDCAPENAAELCQWLQELAAASATIGGGSALAWLGAATCESLRATASLASILPLDLCARAGLRRSQWWELDPGRRGALLAELVDRVVAGLAGAAPAGNAALAALQVLDRRWLRRLPAADAARLRPGDVYSAWRAARRFG
ncbi:MAG: hypothetical protein IT479_05490 [Xanthomonadales bacterium]|nr:hypothetical protein [Anaerolineae bacterium]MCC6592710.1 hypothetical protein [Xanthomonadales bacterium]MCE7931921.1 hypothetical protein [Xanthomonadales bacterium PRO6]